MRRFATLAAITIWFLSGAQPAIAFRSYVPDYKINPSLVLPVTPYLSTNGEHTQVTSDAMAGFGMKASRVDAIAEAVRDQDWKQMSISVTSFSIDPNDKYDPIDHYDRSTKDPTVDAATKARFKDSSAQLRVRVALATTNINAGVFDGDLGAVAAIGRILHAIEDLNSHSNLNTFTDADRDKVYGEIFTARVGDPVLPDGFKLTAFNKTDGGKPPGDPFQHDVNALDKDNGSAAYMKAKANATLFATKVLQRIKDGSNADKFGDLVAAEAPIRSATERGYQWAGHAAPNMDGSAHFSLFDTTVDFPAGVVNQNLTDTVLAPPLNFFKSTDDLTSTIDGHGMMLMREVRADTDLWSQYGTMSLTLSPGTIPSYFDYHSIQPYFYQGDTWVPLSASDLVSNYESTGIEAFRIHQGGVYALGARVVPEPATLVLMSLGLIGLGLLRRVATS